ncbi:MAG: hypothetical protein LCH66_04770 [Actinobacteria bacterium]|nr:hypothetical protein [Actinomycetota bacterium]
MCVNGDQKRHHLKSPTRFCQRQLGRPDATRQVIVRPDTKTVLGVFSSGDRVHDYEEWLLSSVQSILDTDELANRRQRPAVAAP